jgi:hypothetical protein
MLSQSKLTPALSVRCTDLAMDSITEGSRSMGRDGGDTAIRAMQEINA